MRIWVLFLVQIASGLGLGVVEFAGKFPMSPYKTKNQALEEMAVNLDSYRKLVTLNPDVRSSVIAFSEDGLYSPAFPTQDSLLPYIEELPAVATQVDCSNSSVIGVVSCLAQDINSTVVVNMGELLWLDINHTSRKQFNVDIVISPNGTFLAKYRKHHLYYEPAFDYGEGAYATNQTTFVDPVDGKTLYGLLTCNDLTYFHDSIEPLLAKGVDAILAPAWWVNLPPLMTGNSYFSGLSLSYNTTIAVAGCGMGWYCSGSGIFSRGRALASYFNPTSTPSSTYLDSNNGSSGYQIPSDRTSTTTGTDVIDDLRVRRTTLNMSSASSNATIYRFTPRYEGESFSHVITSQLGLRCEVSGTISSLPSGNPTPLAVVAIRGLAPELGFPQWGIEYCGVVACPSDACLSTLVLVSNVTVTNVSVNANFQLDKYRLFPILLQSNAMIFEDSRATCEEIDLHDKGSLLCLQSNNIQTVGGTLSLSLLGMEIQV